MTTFQPDFRYDLIFFDAFAPEKQPALWTQDIFDRLPGPPGKREMLRGRK